MFGLLLVTLASSPAPPVDTLLITRSAGPEAVDGPSRTDLADAARDAALQFVEVRVRERASVSTSDSELRACGPKVECLAARLEGTGVRRVVFTIVNRAATPTLVTVEVLDLDARVVRASQYGEGVDVLSVVRAQVRGALTAGGHTLGADLYLDVTPRHATIRLDERTTSEVSRGVPAGSHELRIEAEGYDAYTERIDLAAGARRDLGVALLKSGSGATRWWIWAIVGGAVAVGMVATTVAASGALRPNTICYGAEACR